MSIIKLTKDNFEKYISGNTKNIIYFSSEKCTLCQILKPIYEDFANRNESTDINFYELDTASNKRITIELKVMNQPTILFLRGRKEIARLYNSNITTKILQQNINNMFTDK